MIHSISANDDLKSQLIETDAKNNEDSTDVKNNEDSCSVSVNESTSDLHISKAFMYSDEKKQTSHEDSGESTLGNDLQHVEKVTCCGFWKNERFFKGCKWSPDEIGNRILILDGDNKLKIYHCFLNNVDYVKSQISSDSYELSCIGNIYDYDWYPIIEPSQYYVIAASSLRPLHIYDVTTSKSISSYLMYNTNDEAVYAHSVACSADGMTILGGTSDYIFLFDINRPGRTYKRILTRPHFKRGIISSIVVNPLRSSLFAVGSYNSHIGIYDETKLLCLLYGHNKGITHLKFSNNGLFLYSGVRGASEIICWDLRNPGTALFRLERVVKTQQRIYFDMSPDSRYIFSGNTDGDVYIWDTTLPPCGEQLLPIHKFRAHSDCTNGISVHKTLPFFATVSGQYHKHLLLEDGESDAEEDLICCEEENSLKLCKFSAVSLGPVKKNVTTQPISKKTV